MYHQANLITAQSNETLEHIKGLLGKDKPLFLYRNLPAGSPARPGSSKGDLIRIIYPGLLGHAQGVLDICRHIDFAALGTSLHIYGSGAELQELTEWVAMQPARGIYLHNPVSAEQLSAMLPDYTAMLVPLVAPIEGALPSKFFTAINVTLPVLFCAGGEGASLVAQHQLGWVTPPGDHNALAGKISQLASLTEAELTTMRARIALASRTIFNKATQDRDFLDTIDKLIGTTQNKKG
jgi:glycosyltransferase involved in cell wall biosynthesis